MIGIFEPEYRVVELDSPVGKWIKVTKYVNEIEEMNPIKQRASSYMHSNSVRSSIVEEIEEDTEASRNLFKISEENLYIGYLGSVSTKEPSNLSELEEGNCFDAFGLLGIWRYDRGITKCLFVTEAEFVTELGQNERIYKVRNVSIVSIINKDYLENPYLDKERNEGLSGEQLKDEFERKLDSARLAEGMIISIFGRGGFYFSTNPNLDITRSVRQSIKYGSKFGDLPEERFCWNYNLLLPLYEGGSSTSKWATPLLSGFIGFSRLSFQQRDESNCENAEIDFLLISRRDCRRQGVRYLCRGANSEGNVSNSVETEQIILVRKPESIQIYSYLQYRGSIPIVWRQIPNLKKTPPFEIYKGEKCQQTILNRHFNELFRKYCNQSGECTFESNAKENTGSIFVVNLIDCRKHELDLGTEFEKYLNKMDVNNIYSDSNSALKKELLEERPTGKSCEGYSNSEIKFCWFDFHEECSKMRWHNLSRLMKKLTDLGLDEINFTSLEIKLKEKIGDLSPIFGIIQGHFSNNDNEFKVIVNSIQNGICRTNCIDCLDRTNVVQSVIGRRVMHSILSHLFNLKLIGEVYSRKADIGSAFEPIPGTSSSNENTFRKLWSDNADALSKLYSGTPAQKTDFTRYGKRTKKGAMQDFIYSTIRFLLNSLVDGYIQDAYFVFTNQCSSPNSDLGIKRNIHDKLLHNKNKYLSPPVMIALGQYLIIVLILLFFPIFQLLILYSYLFGGNLACFIMDIMRAPTKLIFQIYDKSSPQDSLLSLLPSFSHLFFQENKCSIHNISGGAVSLLIIIFGFIQFVKFRGPKIATKPLIDDSNSQIWNPQERKN
ncbi:Sac1p family protein [Cryptosporidium felis]|nr:Sac1p family protein [Cryptosporidium felis]